MAYLGVTPTQEFSSVAKQSVTGDGSVSYTLNKGVSDANDLAVFVNDVRQEPGVAYTATGNTITFTANLESTDDCYILHIGRTFSSAESPGIEDKATQKVLTITTDGHLVPTANVTYDLGTSDLRFRDIYLSGSSINLGDHSITANSTHISMGNVVTTGVMTGNGALITSLNASELTSGTIPLARLPDDITIVNDLTIGGDFIVNGNTTTIAANELKVEDSLIQLASNNEISDTVDIGFVGHYYDGSTQVHTGFFRDASDEQYYLFKGYEDADFDTDTPPATIDRTANTFALADLNVGAFTSSGNVGIGTASPAFGLSVESDNGSGYVALFRKSSSDPTLTIQTTSGITQIQGLNSTLTATNNIALQLSGGNVGIGTASPGYKLDVNGTLRGAGLASVHSGAAEAQVQFVNSNRFIYHFLSADGSLSGTYDSTGTKFIEAYDYTNNVKKWYTSGSERMRIDASGNVGIGNSSPSAWLSSFSALQIGQAASFWAVNNFPYAYMSANQFYDGASKYIVNAPATWYVQELGSHKWFTAPSGTAGATISFTQAMTLDSSGNLGVGTDNPGARTHINGTAGDGLELLRLTSDANVPDGGYHWMTSSIAANQSTNANLIHLIGVAENTKNSAYFGFHYNGNGSNENYIKIGGYAADDLMIIKMNGNVGIGNTSPGAAKLVIEDNAGDGNSTYNGGVPLIQLYSNTAQWSAPKIEAKETTQDPGAEIAFKNIGNGAMDIIFGTRPTGSATSTMAERMRIKNDGNVEIGGNQVWHAGNDGSGSGLDADTLDGRQATGFFKVNGGSITGGTGTEGSLETGNYNVTEVGYSTQLIHFAGVGGSSPTLQLYAQYADELYFRVARDSATNWDSVSRYAKRILHTGDRDLVISGNHSGSFGNRLLIGATSAAQTLQDANLRPTAYLSGAYPVLTLNHTTTTNDNHGPTIQFAHNAYNTNRQWVIGTDGQGQRLDFGVSGGTAGTNSNKNPHNGIAGYDGITIMRLFQNGVLIGSTGTYPNEVTSTSYTLDVRGNGSVTGSFSKGSGSFKIDHPLESKSDTHDLVHSFIEGPQADLIYRGKVNLVDGSATVNIDAVAGMTEGTFVILNREVQCFTTNESDWDAIKGSVSGNILTIECQNTSSSATVSWMVIGERQDAHMYDTEWTDEDGRVIVEPLKESTESTANTA